MAPFCYVDSLLALEIPEEGGRKLNDGELVTLSMELHTAGAGTTVNTLHWFMANMVKYPEVQRKMWEEIKGVVREEEDIVREEDLQRMPYIKAVVMEGLRRHPPGHFLVPHAVSEDVSIAGYVIPKGTTVLFSVKDAGLDGDVWKDPLEFRRERFLEGEKVDITGSRETKMMPFGARRRICPAVSLSILHLEYFAANMVREFEWKAADGEVVDFAETFALTRSIKNPFRAILVPRRRK
ncbi:cytochrome P450 89A2-like [Tasmannia lanceolata]|uniref:cytochrome P450 89A2-like n=1 Tax=Tasmannia lanceolata TaxID=3420 RepID=UPI0040649043